MKRGQRLFLIFLIFALLLCSSAMAFESTMVSMADPDRGDEQIEQLSTPKRKIQKTPARK